MEDYNFASIIGISMAKQFTICTPSPQYEKLRIYFEGPRYIQSLMFGGLIICYELKKTMNIR